MILDRRKQKREGNYAPLKKDLLDLLMDMHDEETDSRMDDEELRAQVSIHGSIMTLRVGDNVE